MMLQLIIQKKLLEKNKIDFISNIENQGYENAIMGFKHILKKFKRKKIYYYYRC